VAATGELAGLVHSAAAAVDNRPFSRAFAPLVQSVTNKPIAFRNFDITRANHGICDNDAPMWRAEIPLTPKKNLGHSYRRRG
jgi:hypothetical protein